MDRNYGSNVYNLGAYLGAQLSRFNGVGRLNNCAKIFYKIKLRSLRTTGLINMSKTLPCSSPCCQMRTDSNDISQLRRINKGTEIPQRSIPHSHKIVQIVGKKLWKDGISGSFRYQCHHISDELRKNAKFSFWEVVLNLFCSNIK